MGINEAHLPLYVFLPYIEKYHVQDSNLILSAEELPIPVSICIT
jgi:hypothetical protein